MANNLGAAGVRIEIIDNSDYTVTANAVTKAGYVGYSQAGEFNKVISLNNLGEISTKLGNGFQSSKWNQALYGVRGAILNGGGAEFVRLFSEVPDTSNDIGMLKSDVFYATYNISSQSMSTDYCVTTTNISGTTYGDQNSVDLHEAYIDRYNPFGHREVYDINTVLAKNGETLDIELDSGFVGNDIALFSIIPVDPTMMERGPLQDNMVVNTASNATFLDKSSVSINYTTTTPAEGDVITFFGTSGVTFELIDSGTVTPGNIEVDISGLTTTQVVAAILDAIETEAADTTSIIYGMSGIQIGDELLLSFQGFDYGTVVADTTSAVVTGTTTDHFEAATTFEGKITINNNTGTAVIADEDELVLFGKTITYALGSASTATGDVVVDLPSDLSTLTSGEIASATVAAINKLNLPNVEVISSIVSSATATVITIGYKGLSDATLLATRMSTDSATGIGITAFNTTGVTQDTTSYDNVLISASLGVEFVSLGLATGIVTTTPSGTTLKKYQLNADGEAVARSYITVDLTLGGDDYSFGGTLVPYAFDDTNLYIVEQTYQYADKFAFSVNDNDAMEDAIVAGTIDLGSSTDSNGFPDSVYTQYATDTAIQNGINLLTGVEYNTSTDVTINTVVWEYDPRNNNSSAGIQSAWQLFLDKDTSDAYFLCSAGCNITNFGSKGMERLDTDVMSSMLDVCDKRKDRIAIFDTVDEKDVDLVIRRTDGINSFSTEMARWGGIYDGRDRKVDTQYTKLTVDVAKSIAVVNRMMANTRGGLWWIPAAGYVNGGIESVDASAQKNRRSYNYAADPNSDIAKLYDAHINPTRVTQGGAFLFGQKSMQKKDTAFNRLNVASLIAGINKRFERFLDRRVFLLNTREFRAEIREELQAQLDAIRTANPAGITSGTVVCDTSNNTASIIRQKKLIVDIVELRSTEAAEFITLRTTIESSGEGENTVTTSII